MKHFTVGLAALSCLMCLTVSPHAQARSLRADLPCPYGGGGGPWTYSGTASTSQFNPGAATSFSALLTGNPGTDDISLSVSGATMYAWYSNPIPATSSCVQTPFPPGPTVQVITYTLSSGDTLSSSNGQSQVTLPTGGTEVEFNYAASGAGSASFTFGGVTFKSTTPGIPSNTANDFVFNSNGSLFGAVSEDGTFITLSTSATTGLPIGWAETSATTSAPEIDPASAIGGLTLLAGCLAVLRGGRRNLFASR